jgi:SulP family sulfate permease
LVATAIAGVLLIIMGLAGMGRLIEYIPYPVTTGFTSGIAVVIATLQLKDFLGLTVEQMPDHYLERVVALAAALPTVHLSDALIGALTLGVLALWPRCTKKIPAPLAGLTVGTLAAVILAQVSPGFEVATIHSRFSYLSEGVSVAGIPRQPPLFALPWTLPGANGQPLELSWDLFQALTLSAFAIAMLGAIESLLSAVVADGMTGGKHDPNAELLAQGLGNIVAPFFGGIAATGAIARTATNVRCGARSPIAAIIHAAFVLAAVLLLAPVLGWLPMASLAALLLVVAWNMSEVRHFGHMLRVAPRSDVAVLLTCFGLTVVFDMVISITIGVILAALLFMRRMAEVSSVRVMSHRHALVPEPLPAGVVLYEIAGALFFGAAHKAMSALRTVEDGVKVVVLDVRSVLAMDATGLVNLSSAIERLHKMKVFVILAGVQSQPWRVMARAGWRPKVGELALCRSFTDGLELAQRVVGQASAGVEPPEDLLVERRSA